MPVLLAAVIGYLLGAIPTGMVVARVYRNVDLTVHGSGRTGATNVLRTLGSGAAAVAFGGDFLKGVLAVAAVKFFIAPDNTWIEMVAAIAAVVGHSYSVFIRFKGGRGVVTGFGASLVAAPVLMLVAFAIGVALVLLTRYVSLGSVVGAILGGLFLCGLAYAQAEPAWALWGVLVGGFIVVAHKDNIERLLAGKERKLGERAL
ncbi:MAG: glycerol-3-phosphate 1-O-acyltransferase PlsY [Chloroflexi bacterium]|nr:glycerol-3-phosphate 1-O-acyltransferase PlsY [Chloroflexota bacterium]MBV9893987.1 glycerol-3-phosphate 1-O-acyltransferase PlsY [Chloroflexota bacterium]